MNTSYYTITDDVHYIEVAWSAATSPGANNGELTLYVDGVQKESITNIDNDTIYIDRVLLGAVTEIDTGTRGTYYFDAFESRLSGYIGPVAALPGNSVALVVPADSFLASISYWLLDWLLEVWETVEDFFQPDKAFAGEIEAEAASELSVIMLEESIPTGQVWKTYYYAGSQRVAMRVNDGVTDEVYYLFSDHLGSTSITTDSEGNWHAELRYTAWGEVRYSSGQTPTDYTYTGQRSEVGSFGLMYYNARWYDSALGRFVQADLLVPNPFNTLAHDRYMYVLNNPLRYTDPTGNYCYDVGNKIYCDDGSDSHGNWNQRRTLPDSIDPSQLNTGGTNLYWLYLQLWYDNGGWWWDAFGSDGTFDIYDFTGLIIYQEVYIFIDDTLIEGAVRAFYGWCHDQNCPGKNGATLLNWIYEYSSTIKNIYRSVRTGSGTLRGQFKQIFSEIGPDLFPISTIPAQSATSRFRITPSDWTTGWENNRPYGWANLSNYSDEALNKLAENLTALWIYIPADPSNTSLTRNDFIVPSGCVWKFWLSSNADFSKVCPVIYP